MGKCGLPPQKQVSTKWSSELAYAVGLITTDGCLSKDGRHIDFTSKDTELVKTLRRCLGLRNKIGSKKSGTGKEYARIQFGDIHFYEWLEGLGLSPRKSRVLTSVKVPGGFFFDFVRGCFDGDGTIYSFWDKRWADSFMFYIAFASGSKEFLLWLRKRLKHALRTSGHIAPGTRNTFQLRYAKRESIVLFRHMFYAVNIPCLRRKLLKAQLIFAQHNKVVDRNKYARVVKFSKHATLRGWCP